jgi:mannose-6-phosphate isomerase-like protein (cupin superfamily)
MTPTRDDGPGARLVVVPPGGGVPVVRLNGEDTVLTVGEAETRGAYAMRLNTAPPNFTAVPLHIHHSAEEAFFVLGGELTIHAGGNRVQAPAGSYVLIPRGMSHAIANIGAAPVRWLTMISPAAQSGWVDAEHELLVDADGAPDPGQVAEIHRRFGLEIVGPPPFA